MDNTTRKVTIIKDYLRFLESGNADEILKLFTSDAKVTSPRTGTINAKDFYTGLFSLLKNSSIKISDILQSIGDKNAFAAYFDYNWELNDGSKSGMKCVDIIKFSNTSDLIEDLSVVAYLIHG